MEVSLLARETVYNNGIATRENLLYNAEVGRNYLILSKKQNKIH